MSEPIAIVTAAEAARRLIRPGDILLTAKPSGMLARAILWGQAVGRGEPANFKHAMRAAAGGTVISQETSIKQLQLEHWIGEVVRVWSYQGYTDRQRQRLVEEAALGLGRPYDYLGIFGQLLRAVPLAGGWLSRAVEEPWATYCSEHVCQVQRKVDQGFMGKRACQVSPQDLDDWCRQAAGWECMTVRLAA